jgi:hypothetical protein
MGQNYCAKFIYLGLDPGVLEKVHENTNNLLVNYTTNSIKYDHLSDALVNVSLYSLNGQRIFKSLNYSNNGELEIRLPIQKMNSGCYFIKTTIDGNCNSEKFYYEK